MSSGMFRGKESSSRIKLSQLVQELLNFDVLGSLWLWGWGGWVNVGGGWLGVPPTHMYTHAHAHTHTHTCMCGKHDNFMQMVAPIGESMGIPYDVICTCVCMHVHVCACVHVHVYGGHPSTTPTSIQPPPTPGGTPRISQNSIALELIELFQFCLKI